MALIARVRTATAAAHQSLEDRLDIFGKVSDVSTRRRLVARFYGLHAGLETAIAPVLADWDGLDFDDRRRAPHLRRDLRALGLEPDDVALHPAPTIGGPAEALGILYVLEGSTLGGAVIEKQLRSRGEVLTGLGFLHPYGDQTGPRWKAFLAVLEALGDDSADDVIEGARRGFALTEDWLCQPDGAA